MEDPITLQSYSLIKQSDDWDTLNSARKLNVAVDSSIPIGLYNLKVQKGTSGSWRLAENSVQILNGYKADFKFVQLTDIHLGNQLILKGFSKVDIFDWVTTYLPWGDRPYYRTSHLTAIIDRLNNIEKPDFIVVTGDMINYDNENSMKAFKGCLYKSKIPIFVTVGNHDRYYLKTTDFTDYIKVAPISLPASLKHPWPGEPDSFYKFINPKFLTDEYEDINRPADFYFDYYNCRFLIMDAGNTVKYWLDGYENCVPDFEKMKNTNQLDGFTNQQCIWLIEHTFYKDSNDMKVFVFLHSPVVGHRGNQAIINYNVGFVEWANDENSGIEAVFCGHTHNNRCYHDVTKLNIDGPYCYYTKPLPVDEIISPTSTITLLFSNPTFYFETENTTGTYPQRK